MLKIIKLNSIILLCDEGAKYYEFKRLYQSS